MFAAKLAGGIEIRPVEDTDVSPLFAVVERNHAHLRQWLSWVDATHSEDDIGEFAESAIANNANRYAFTSLIRCDGEIAGVIACHKVDWVNRKCEIGYWLAKEHVGRGVMSACCRAFLAYLFGECDLHRIECQCGVGNVRSNAIPQRLGFTKEGIVREGLLLDGRYHDMVQWSLLRQEWAKSGQVS